MNIESVKLRQEKPSDYRAVEELTREAFWNNHVPGCDEHYLVHVVRDSEDFIRELDIVAVDNDKIIGSIIYTKGKILKDNGEEKEVICFGPISVLPEYQGKGIGKLLIENTKRLAKELGYTAIMIYGDPDYYSKVGFKPAEEFKIGTPDNMYAVALQGFELIEGALSNCSGRFLESSVFAIDGAKAAEYDKSFSTKELRENLPNQRRFLQLVNMRIPRK